MNTLPPLLDSDPVVRPDSPRGVRIGPLLGCLLLVALAILAGCVAPSSGGEQPVGLADASADGTDSAAPTDRMMLQAGSPNATVVSVEAPGDRVAPVDPVRQASDYWAARNVTDSRSIVVAADVPDPDVVVRVARDPLHCDADDDRGDERPDFYCLRSVDDEDPTVVVLSPGLTDEGYRSAATAALGHVYGLESPLSRADLAEPTFADPWPSSHPVTVRIDNEVAPDRDFEPLVRQAIRYWEANDERWGTYATDWEIVDDPDADVAIAFVDELERCGDHPSPEDLIGCAPVRTPENLADGDERVRVRGGYDDETTLLILKHELGHLYGVSHGEEPADVMVDSIATTPR